MSVCRPTEREWFFEALDRVLQRFSPPADLSSSEKKAWVKGLYHAVDVMTDVALSPAVEQVQTESEDAIEPASRKPLSIGLPWQDAGPEEA